MKKLIFCLIILTTNIDLIIGQITLFDFDFDDCTFEESGMKFPGITPGGDPQCICGLDEKSYHLDGT